MIPSSSGALSGKIACSQAKILEASQPTGQLDHLVISMCIVDDEEYDRLLMRWILERSGRYRCIGTYANADEALNQIPRLRPDAVLMDIRLPGMSGIECARRLKAAMPQLKIIVVSGLQDEDSMDKSLDAGADAYLIKPFSVEECLAILKFAVRNLIPSSGNSDELRESSGYEPNLTARQNQVMQLLSNGFVPKEIPDQLGISHSAVHKHQVNSYRKLGAHNRMEALNKWRHSDGT